MNKLEIAFIKKKEKLLHECRYGFSHFCDGTPNKSITSKDSVRPPCPDRIFCSFRQRRLFPTLEEERRKR